MNITLRSLIHDLLYQSLIEIRVAAHEHKNFPAIFKIANVFHNVPLQLEKAAQGEREYQQILDDIIVRAERNDCSAWLDNAITKNSKSNQESMGTDSIDN